MPEPHLHLLVCTNDRGSDSERPSCGQRGGLEVYRRLKDAVRAHGLKPDVLVTRTGCLHHCSRGVSVCVWPHNHWYGNVAEADAEEILAAARGGRRCERLRMPPGPWE